MKASTLFIFSLLLSCAGDGPNKKNNMTKIINTDSGEKIAEMEVLNDQLHGMCTWYNLNGVVVAKGEFKNGKPWNGQILNWNKFTSNKIEQPWGTEFYCRDWITFFEISFASVMPDYNMVREVYQNGKVQK